MKKLIVLLLVVVTVIACKKNTVEQTPRVITPKKVSTTLRTDSVNFYFDGHSEFIADSFDFPVGKPDAKGYYNAQKFTENNHLGDDWNGKGGGDTDLGDPIFSIANGYVKSAENIGGGWGNVIRILHLYEERMYESIYAHCDTISVIAGQYVKKGALIGTIGNADGIYKAHLHLEIRDQINRDIGGGYSTDTQGYLDPTKFIQEH